MHLPLEGLLILEFLMHLAQCARRLNLGALKNSVWLKDVHVGGVI